MLAHRFSYEHYRGPIRDTAFACHYCDVPSCCNPAHLFIGTQKDNMADAKEKGRISAGEHRPLSVLTAQEVRAIRAATGRQKEIADVYGVHQVTISKIKRGLLWSHLKS